MEGAFLFNSTYLQSEVSLLIIFFKNKIDKKRVFIFIQTNAHSANNEFRQILFYFIINGSLILNNNHLYWVII